MHIKRQLSADVFSIGSVVMVKACLMCWKNMNNLVLSLAPKFTKLLTLDTAVETIAKFCHGLQDLDLSKSFKLGDRSLYALAYGCRNLAKLNISGCTSFSDEGLEYLTKFCRKLKILNLCGCVKAATDCALHCSFISKFISFIPINLTRTWRIHGFQPNTPVAAIGQNNNMLHSLNLGWCDNVGDLGVTSLAYGCPDLRCLDLCGCVRITDDSLIALASGCLHLRSIGLYYCRNIIDRAMYSLAYSRVKNKASIWQPMKGRYDEEGLRSLNISQCTALTPSAV
ncbi:hypothetical protein ES288_D05G172700v1 [Gossypium darwinii]|uniref:F-box/LRR-repeat protein 15-like leucin rich repeat domain-containing protein n=1 Tax=Gossypium darwinii TaxID=34276 RepID=A0A5D2CKF1_GOSDA|nr:hypothetical protein ES288_D05G172700v1 [Gossypium darwinii]